MEKNNISYQSIELQNISIYQKSKKKNSLKNKDVPINYKITSKNLKANKSKIYEFDNVKLDKFKNNIHRCSKKGFIFLLTFFIINWIILYVCFLYFQKINSNKNTKELQKKKDVLRKILNIKGEEILIKVNESNGEINNILNITNLNIRKIENKNDTDKDEEIKNCNAKDFFQNSCKSNFKNYEMSEKYIYYILDEIQKGSFGDIFEDITKNDKEFVNSDNGITYTLSTISNQKLINSSIIYLDECETELRNKKEIDQDEKLILFKLEYSIDGLNIPLIEYSLFKQNGQKINLDLCNGIPVSYSNPASIKDNKEFMYNPKSDFYQDKCSPYKSDYGTDITIFDRKNDFNNKHLSLCEKNCEYKGYDANNKRVNCECQIKTEFPSIIKNINIDKKELLNNFKDFGKNSNLFVILCYKLFFSKEGMSKNICSYLMIIFTSIIIGCSIFFAFKGYTLFARRINDLIFIKILGRQIPSNKFQNDNMSFNKFFDVKNNQNIKSKTKKEEIFFFDNDYEINYSTYSQASIFDNRAFFGYYFSFLKTNHLIFFTFYTKTDYNSRIIKISLFVFYFSLFLTVNALFFDDESMHQIYIDKGMFNFSFQIPQIIYSTIISCVIKLILNQLSLTEKKIVSLKQKVFLNRTEAINETLEVLNKLKKQFIIFFILNIVFHLLFWYYLGCFGAVYKNTQVTLIKDSIISFVSSLIYPFFITLIPCVLRYKALNSVNKDKTCLYKISVFSQSL